MMQQHYSRRKTRTTGGFSLIEMLVAVAIFSIVMMVAVGALLMMVDANRKAQGLKSAINNVNFALESMSRNIRFGTNYHCTNGLGAPASLSNPLNCTNGANIVAFEAYDGDPDNYTDQVVYRYNNFAIERSVNAGGTFIPITAPEVSIDHFQFYVTGAPDSDTLQPRVLMVIRGHIGNTPKTRTEFNLQTTVSQRILDL
jgi:prepilin-type N-terminal cleavage/methylation domain-containing protein